MIKMFYVYAMRGARSLLAPTGLLRALDRSEKKSALWLRSLFSIYDSNDMVALDTPWWTFAAIERVEHFLIGRKGAAQVFEFGAGASTVWLAKRAASVVSVEHDTDFMTSMEKNFSQHDNVRVMLVPPGHAMGAESEIRSQRKGYGSSDFTDYVSSIDQIQGEFDVIIIDGRARSACLAAAAARLSPSGIIVFDNSNRREYREAIAVSGLHATVYRGLAPALPYPSETTILRRVA